MTETFFLAVDPGTVTGYSYGYLSEILTNGRPEHGQQSPQPFCEWVDSLAQGFGHDLITIVERFTIGPRTMRMGRAGMHDALDVIGVCRYVSKRYCGRDLEMYMPDDVMGLFTNDWLKERGWYVKGQGHANDSMRHLAMAFAERKLIRVSG